jgi:hypothetical protein
MMNGSGAIQPGPQKGAESSGEINGLGWRVFRQNGTRSSFVLAAYVAEGVRRRMRLPIERKKLTTPSFALASQEVPQRK